MHARVVTIQLQPGMTGRAVGMFEQAVIPAAKQQHGFQGGFLLADRGAGKLLAISLWETEADLLTSETNGYYQEQIAKLAGVGVFGGPPFRESFEVSVQV